jgi:hypothetical protein
VFGRPACRLDDVHITHIIERHDDVLVGYRGGIGSWVSIGDPSSGVMRRWSPDSQGELALPRLVRDARVLHTPTVEN